MIRLRTAVLAGICLGSRWARAFSQPPLESLDVVVGDSIGGDGLVVISRKQKADSVVVWLHGLGDTAYGWLEPMAMLAEEHPKTRFILPTAPSRPVTLNNGFVMPAWMDIAGLPTSRATPENEPPVDEEGLDESAQRVLRIVQKQVDEEGVPRDRVVLGGFSQGGAVALHVSMAYDVTDPATNETCAPAAATIAASTWLPLSGRYPGLFKPTSKNIRVFQCHGDEDPIVRRDWGVYRCEKKNKIRWERGLLRWVVDVDGCGCGTWMWDVDVDVLTKKFYLCVWLQRGEIEEPAGATRGVQGVPHATQRVSRGNPRH